MTTVLAIDQGTTRIKALIVESGGTVLARASRPIATTVLPGGGMEQDPREIWEAVLAAASAAIGESATGIDAVAVANQGESVMAWDRRTGEPLTALMTWQDQRAIGLCDHLSGQAELVAAMTGLRLEPYYSAPKMAWIRRTVTTDGVITTGDTWLAHWLTGRFVTDAATASRSLLVALASGSWDPALTRVFGLEKEELPQIVGNDEVIGTTSVFGREVPVASLILDQPAALLGQRCLDAGESKLTVGTGGFYLRNTGPTIPVTPGLAAVSTAWQIGGRRTFCADGAVFALASALEWIERIGLIDSVHSLDAICADVVPGTAMFDPGFNAPLGATWMGLQLDTTRAEMAASVVYGLAAALADEVEETGFDSSVLSVDGGLTASRTLMQALSNLLQVPLRIYPGRDATAMGAAALAQFALAGAGEITDFLGPRAGDGIDYVPVFSLDQAAAYRTGLVARGPGAAESAVRR